MAKVLVAYFSASGVTKGIAQKLAEASNGDIYEIEPAIPYTAADLDWLDKNSRTTLEMRDKNSRPEIKDTDAKVGDYDVIFIGFPIWWYIAPTIINTFLEKYDFSNKKIVLFATSGGSGFGEAVKNLKPSVDGSCEIIEGRLLNHGTTVEDIKSWVQTLGL